MNSSDAGVETEARVLKWFADKEPISEEDYWKFFDEDAYCDIPEELWSGVYRGTKLGGVPDWVQNPEVPPPPYRFAGQIADEYVFTGPAPNADEIGCRVNKRINGEWHSEYPRIMNQSLEVPGWIEVEEDGTYKCTFVSYGDPGTPETWNQLQDSIAFSDEIQQEDIQLCEDVWRNLQTGVYDSGRYCVKRENGVHHFHGLLCEFLERGEGTSLLPSQGMPLAGSI